MRGEGCENQEIEPEIIHVERGQKEARASSGPGWCAIRDEDRTFPLKSGEIVKSIYHFFRSECSSPKFKLSEWADLGHEESMTEQEKI